MCTYFKTDQNYPHSLPVTGGYITFVIHVDWEAQDLEMQAF